MDPKALARQYRELFDRDGYILVRGFLSPAETAELQDRFAQLIAEKVPTYAATDAFYEVKGKPETLKYIMRLEKHDSYFTAMATDPRFADFARGLLGDDVVPHGIEWFNKCSRVGQATPPHQDGYYYILEPNEGVHYWLALDAVDEGNGCVRYIPGSHRRGLRPHHRSNLLGFSQTIEDWGPADIAMEKPTLLQPGDMLAHHTLSIHRAEANTSSRERRAMGLVYHAARAKHDVERAQAYQKKLHEDLTKAGKI